MLILDTDWDSIVWHATDTEQMGRLLAAWIEQFADPYLPRTQDLHRLGEEARYFFSLNRYLFLAHR